MSAEAVSDGQDRGRAIEVGIQAYVQAWNTTDPSRRRMLLESCWSPGATYQDPATQARGAAELVGVIEAFGARWPGGTVEIVGGVNFHHEWASFAWQVRGGDQEILRDGFDVVELDPSGLIRRVVGFFGVPPWAGAPGSGPGRQ